MGRFAAPEEMTVVVGFLASEEAGYLTGTVLPVVGGLAIRQPWPRTDRDR